MTTDPNENTQAEIYANIRDKALEEAAHEAWVSGADRNVVEAIRALKIERQDKWHDFMCEVFGGYP